MVYCRVMLQSLSDVIFLTIIHLPKSAIYIFANYAICIITFLVKKRVLLLG